MKKCIVGLAAIGAVIAIFGISRSSVSVATVFQRSPISYSTDESYRAAVDEARAGFASQRERLGLSNALGETSTTEVPLGRPSCEDTCGGGSAGGGSGTDGSSPSAVRKPCTATSKGAPIWMVNMIGLNFYMTDTPMWYSSPIGPRVEVAIHYNSLAGVLSGSPLGNKWQLGYGSSLYPVADNQGGVVGVAVTMPDGRWDVYYTSSNGGYTHPYRVFNTLTQPAKTQFPYRYQMQFPDGTIYVYDIPSGTTSNVSLLTQIIDPYGQKLSLGYDATAKLTTVTDAMGKTTNFTYNSGGLLTTVTDPFSRTALFQYDSNKNLTKVTDMGGYSTSFTYDSGSYLTGVSNPTSNWKFYIEPPDSLSGGSYPPPGDSMGRSSRITVTNPSGGNEEYFSYDVFANSSMWHVSPKDYVSYSPGLNNSSDSVLKTVYQGSMTQANRYEVTSITSPESTEIDLTYGDSDYNVTQVVQDPSQYQFTYNSSGQVLTITDPLGAITNITYAQNGIDPVSIQDGLGTITSTYDNYHGITSVTDRMGKKKAVSYNGYGQILSTTDPLGTVTTFDYDSTTHLLKQVAANGSPLKSFTYDAVGRISSYTDASGMTRTYAYDNLDEVTGVTYPDGKSVEIAYSKDIPHLVTEVDTPFGLTQYIYNASKKLTSIIGPGGTAVAYGYDANGIMNSVTDAAGNLTSFSFDEDNRLTEELFADGTSKSFTYSGSQMPATFTNARQQNDPMKFPTASYGYDSAENLTMIEYSDGYPIPVTRSVMFQYDVYGRRKTMSDGAGSVSYTYDANSRLTSISGPNKLDSRTLNYDANGRMTGYTLQSGQTVSYTYDAFDRLTGVTGGAGKFTYAYSDTSPTPLVRRLTRPCGSYTDYVYDNLNRLTGVTNKTSTGTIINQYQYTYDDRDLRATETVTDGNPVASFNNGSETLTYNEVNELLTSGGSNFLYDLDGNTTQLYTPNGEATAEYDAENRLIDIKDSAHETEFVYSGDNTLAKKYLDKLTTYTVTNYVRLGELLLQERDDNNNVIREYIYGTNSGGGIGGLLSYRQNGSDYYYLYDGKGNVTAIINSAQNVVATYEYDPFGNLTASTGALDQPFKFSTRAFDATTGLYYYDYRLYQPTLGRWITRDPSGFSGGLNLYEFVNSNPVNLIDPLGNYGIGYAWNWWKDYFNKAYNKQKRAWCKGGDPRDAVTAIKDIDMLKPPPVRWISPGDVAELGVQNVDAYFNRMNSMMPKE